MFQLGDMLLPCADTLQRWYGAAALPFFARRFPPRLPSEAALSGKPSVCLVEGWLGPGGAERQLANLAVALKQWGHNVRVRVLSLEGRAGHYAPFLRERGVDVEALPAGRNIEDVPGGRILARAIPEELRPAVATLAEDLLQTPVDIVHAYYDHPNIFGAWAATLARVPAVRCSWRDRNPEGMFYHAPWMLPQYRLLARMRNLRFEANSRFAAQSYAGWIGIDSTAVDVVPNAMSGDFASGVTTATRQAVRKELGIPMEAAVLVFSGRISPKKCPFDMLRAFLAVMEKRQAVHCLVAGSDFLDANFNLAVESCPRSQVERLHLLGLRGDMAAVLVASDILLQTSSVESCSNTLLEAMYMGLPVVTTAVGGTPEVVEEGVNGFLVPPGDVDTMVERLLRLVDTPDLRANMGTAGKDMVQRYSVAAFHERITAAYGRMLERG